MHIARIDGDHLIAVDEADMVPVEGANVDAGDLARHAAADGSAVSRLAEGAEGDVGVEGEREVLVQHLLHRRSGERDALGARLGRRGAEAPKAIR